MAFRKDLTGKRFFRLKVLKYVGRNGHRESMYLCKCTCGSKKVLLGYVLNSENTRSCGCYQSECTGNRARTHGLSHTSEYNAWRSMYKRCYIKSHKAYKHYGGRGIKICKRWLKSFENFIKDMGRKASPDLSIDRINVNGNYTPSNCRWADAYTQVHNRRISFRT